MLMTPILLGTTAVPAWAKATALNTKEGTSSETNLRVLVIIIGRSSNSLESAGRYVEKCTTRTRLSAAPPCRDYNSFQTYRDAHETRAFHLGTGCALSCSNECFHYRNRHECRQTLVLPSFRRLSPP